VNLTSTLRFAITMAFDEYDLLILTDATASMDAYLRSLNQSLPEIIRISALTGCFSRIGILAYRDYCGGKLTDWSGWYSKDSDSGNVKNPSGQLSPARGQHISRSALLEFAKRLRPEFGGDWPEAVKTGLAHAYEVMRADAKTIMLLYADAPPHTPATGGNNRLREQRALKEKEEYGGYGHLFIDWISAARALRAGEKRAQVFSIIQTHLADTIALFT
jgi:hypothetical protein